MTGFCVAWFSWLYFEQAGYVLTLQSSAECWFQWPVARSWFQFLPRVSSRLVFGLKKIGWFWAGYLYHGNWRYTAPLLPCSGAGFILGYRLQTQTGPISCEQSDKKCMQWSPLPRISRSKWKQFTVKEFEKQNWLTFAVNNLFIYINCNCL